MASTSTGLKTNKAWTCSNDNGVTWNPAYEIQDNVGWGEAETNPVDGVSTDAKWIWTGKDDWNGKQPTHQRTG